MDFDLDPIQHNNLGEVVYRNMANALLKGVLRPNDRLRVRDLAQQAGTSVTPVRDAILRLVQDGALIMKSPRDIRVPMLAPEQYLEIRAIRLHLEGLAAEQSALLANADDIDRLEALIRDNERALDDHDFALATEINQVFHFELTTIARMPLLRNVLHTLWLRMGPVIAASYEIGGRTMIRHHYDLLDAVRRSDPAGARRAIREDIRRGGRVILNSGALAPSPPEDVSCKT